ncbi:hypothetical protein QUB42_04095 [Microcoleus sp. Aus8_D1]
MQFRADSIAGKTLNPYQGLKPIKLAKPFLSGEAGKTINPYQGLKRLQNLIA